MPFAFRAAISYISPESESHRVCTVTLGNFGSIEQTYVFAITKPAETAEIRVYTLPVKRAELAKQIESFREQLATRDLGFRDSAAKLYELFLGPAQAQLRAQNECRDRAR